MSELPQMAFPQRSRDPIEQLQAGGSDLNQYLPSIFRGALAGDQTAFREFVEQSRDIGSPRDELSGEFQRQQRHGVRCLEQTQCVVLLRCQFELPEQFVFQLSQAVVGSPQVQENFLFQRIEPRGAAVGDSGWGSTHVQTIFVPTTIVETAILSNSCFFASGSRALRVAGPLEPDRLERVVGEPESVRGWEADCEIGPFVRVKFHRNGQMGLAGKNVGRETFSARACLGRWQCW